MKTREVKAPERGTAEAAGIDFYVPEDFEEIILLPGMSLCVPSGIKMIIPEGWCLLFVNKSGWGKKGLDVGACLVDSDYRGEVHLDIHNRGKEYIRIHPGLKITQGMILPAPNGNPFELEYEEFMVYANTERGEEGFGSTGV